MTTLALLIWSLIALIGLIGLHASTRLPGYVPNPYVLPAASVTVVLLGTGVYALALSQ
ncbi:MULTISPECIES: hypothetical protein [Streptomycetaceae]|uniref:Uncharacterized protein n=1 Tax=Streptantibioticus cattleyicolor (strain ATCC 35852 / DSM 46488 / JCM 4925 / NBRC 14057 / NRRL 8057) TaxID=1003195 RepID=F8JT31_STREN|nr:MULTISPECIES: hypothetical protein [Streptomycetaceae]AEW92966.1 hypothetical protein SCATT_05950 [Streptantibioticus cattleyicolor NRRL 8057 = DSM 46488]CCB73327.1 exported protein of unknown function [Streptantibioticus cattleyicolor NRRL 8057 = DSM 46488]